MRGREGGSQNWAGKFQQRVGFVKVPGQAGADRYGALEVLACCSHALLQAGEFFLRKMRIEHPQDTAIIFPSEFAVHQSTGALGSFPTTATRTIHRVTTTPPVA